MFFSVLPCTQVVTTFFTTVESACLAKIKQGVHKPMKLCDNISMLLWVLNRRCEGVRKE